MAVSIDAGVLSFLFYEKATAPNDFRDGKPITKCRERIDGLIEKLEKSGDRIIVPTPALSEALVLVAPDIEKHVEGLESQACFEIAPFDKRAAIEVALRTKSAIKSGDKKEGSESSWDKIKYDRQIVAISKVAKVSAIYSTDRHVHEHGKKWEMLVLNISDLPVPEKQGELFDGTKKAAKPEVIAVSTDAGRSGVGSTESSTTTQNVEAREAEKQQKVEGDELEKQKGRDPQKVSTPSK